MPLKGRDTFYPRYRYGFNGQEEELDFRGFGRIMGAEFWQYDARLGRRWNIDPRPTIGISSYAAFNNNPIFNSDPLGDTTLPTPGNYNTTVELPDNATFETYKSNGGYNVGGKTAPVKEGQLRNFTIKNKTYNATWNSKTFEFLGYRDSQGNSGSRHFKTVSEETGITGFDIANIFWEYVSPFKGYEGYVSIQMKKTVDLPKLPLIESTKGVLTAYGLQGGYATGYNSPDANGFFGNFVTIDRSYLNFSLSKGIDARLVPFNGAFEVRPRGIGDFNVQGRTLITVFNEKFAQVQFDAIANRNLIMIGDRLKFETPKLAGWSIEGALGLRLDLQWPKYLRK